MEEQFVNERKFRSILEIWHRSGRGLISLPKIIPLSSGIQISVVSIDNTVEFIYEQKFVSFREVLSWYGDLIDKISN
jgi:hypothetical protein